MSRWRIAPAGLGDRADWVAMRCDLWPVDSVAAHESDVMRWLAEDKGDRLALIARLAGGAPAGFAEASIRRDHVNGCETSPVLFLEGIYTALALARCGLARALVDTVAAWGRARGLIEFASDAALDDPQAQAFHRAIGFAETERVVFFRRALA